MEEKRMVVELAWAYSEPIPPNASLTDLFWLNYGYEMAEQNLPWKEDPKKAEWMQDLAWNRAMSKELR